MNLIPQIAKMLGVKTGEEFKIKFKGEILEHTYRISDRGAEHTVFTNDDWCQAGRILEAILDGEAEIVKLTGQSAGKMKCPKCGGSGISCEAGQNFCTRCNGTGESAVTWQERMQTCSRRELAELIYKMCNFDCIIDSACDPETPDYRESVNEAYEWLQTECKYEL